MKIVINDDIIDVLEYHKRLFNYKNIIIFPCISKTEIKPMMALSTDTEFSFIQTGELSWLNYHSEILTFNNLKTSVVRNFFTHFNIDILLPVREGKECFGFLALSANNKKLNQIEKNINLIIVKFLASYWKNQHILQRSQVTTKILHSMFNEITSLLEISHVVESGKDLQNSLDFIMEESMRIMKAEAASLMLMVNNKELKFRVALGPKGKDVKPFRLPVGKGIAGWVAKHGKPLLIPDAYKDKRFNPEFDKKSGFKTKSIICVPMIYKDKIIGILQVLNRKDGAIFHSSDLRIFTIFASQAALAIENSRLFYSVLEKEIIEKDLSIAAEIQRLMIPLKLPEIEGITTKGTYLPSKDVGGDIYGIFPISENETVFCIGDVSGKGVPGALLVSTLHATLKAYLEFTSDIKLILNKLNQLIIEISTKDKYITFFIAHYNRTTSELSFINAGHNPPYWLQRGKPAEKLKSNGMAIGVMPYEYKTSEIKIKTDDLLVLYTDGLVEAWDERKKAFGDKKLNTIVNLHNEFNCTLLHDIIIQYVNLHTENVAKADDFALLVLQFL
jgi:sigma-B regulation protein RsbU (phosphoserine phosphatase)